MEVNEWKGRYLLLLCDCLIAFGCFFCVDIPSALQTELQSNQGFNCSQKAGNVTCCEECLGIGPDRYNQLYAVFSWMAAFVVLPVGYAQDRIGNRVTSIFATLLALLGSSLFALSVMSGIRETPAMFPLMITGRLLLGAGNGACQLVQDRVIAFWFQDKLGLAFGAIVSVIRCGNVLNFLLTSNVAAKYGVQTALWVGCGACCIGLLAAIGYCVMDEIGTRKLHKECLINTRSESIRLKDICNFPLSFWLVVIMISTYYSCFIPYVANGSKYIQDRYGYSRIESSYINGAVYDISIITTLLSGLLLDRFGGRAISATIGSFLSIAILLILMFLKVEPIILTIWFGTMYSMTVVSLWPSVSKIIPLATLGTANGIAACFQGLNIGLTNLGVGKILGYVEESNMDTRLQKWRMVLLVLVCQASLCSLCGVLLNINETRKNGVLNKRYQKKSCLLESFPNEKTLLINGSEKPLKCDIDNSSDDSIANYTIQGRD